MKKFFILSALFIFTITSFANKIDKYKAEKVATNFFYERINQYEPTPHHNIIMEDIIPIEEKWQRIGLCN